MLLISSLATDDTVRSYHIAVDAPYRVRVVVDRRGLTARAPRTGPSQIESTFTDGLLGGGVVGVVGVVAALSRRVIVESWSDGIVYRQCFTDWHPDAPPRVVGPTGRRGFDVVLVLDDPAALEHRMLARLRR